MEQRLSLFNNTTSTNNVSIIEMTKQQEIIRDRPIFIGIGIILFILIEVIGNGSLLTMIIYEKYGMDIKKRTVNNQLLSSLCKGSVFCNVLIYPFIWTRVSFSISLGMFHKKASHLTNHYSTFVIKNLSSQMLFWSTQSQKGISYYLGIKIWQE